jgi:predicted NBD/HSP70 family sugar kinase
MQAFGRRRHPLRRRWRYTHRALRWAARPCRNHAQATFPGAGHLGRHDAMSTPPVVLGIDFGASKIALAACGIDGARLASATIATGAGLGARAVFDRGIEAAHSLLASVGPGDPVAVGVATVGIPFDDHVELAPTIPGWGQFALGRELRAAFHGSDVKIATDVKAATEAEVRWGCLAGRDPAVYLNLGTGLAAAVVVDGRVLAGRHGAAGEIGYNLRGVHDVGRGPSGRTPLEQVVSGHALARRAQGMHGRRSRAAPLADAAAVFEASAADAAVTGLIADFTAELAFHLVNLAILIDPQRIAVGGGMVRSWDQLRPGLEQALAAGVPFPPELVVADFPFDAPLMGAVALAIDATAAPAAHRRGLRAGAGRRPPGRWHRSPARRTNSNACSEGLSQ